MKTPRAMPQSFDFGLFTSVVAPKPHALFLDYDGTLAEFNVDRKKARPTPEMLTLLERLASSDHSRIAIISGRTVQDLRTLLGEKVQIEMWGDYGWERWRPGVDLTIWSAPKNDALVFMKAASLAASYVNRESLETKTASVAVHTRALAERERQDVAEVITRLWQPLAEKHDLELLPFNGGFELRDILRTKGTAVRALRDELGPDTHACFMGDDIADEDAFAEIGGDDWSILVAPAPRPSYARYWLRPGSDVIRFLRNWIHWEGGGHVPD